MLSTWLLLDADLACTHARYAHENENGDVGDQIPNAVPKVASIGVSAQDPDAPAAIAAPGKSVHPKHAVGRITANTALADDRRATRADGFLDERNRARKRARNTLLGYGGYVDGARERPAETP